MTPVELHPLVSDLCSTTVGVDGELLEVPEAEERGFSVETHDHVIHVSVPHDAEGGHRKVMT